MIFKPIFFISVFLLFFSDAKTHNYEDIFAEDYRKAHSILVKNDLLFQYACHYFEVDACIAKSIVFPELIRYNLLKDFFEVAALKVGYVEKGADIVDFSIGEFQMKPSFIEQLEKYVVSFQLKKFYFITKYTSTSLPLIRSERIDRLCNLYWQIVYLNCFINIASLKFANIQFLDIQDKIKLYATAYNSGLHCNKNILLKNAEKKYFPYGKHYKGEQYSYSDVSLFYYNQLKK